MAQKCPSRFVAGRAHDACAPGTRGTTRVALPVAGQGRSSRRGSCPAKDGPMTLPLITVGAPAEPTCATRGRVRSAAQEGSSPGVARVRLAPSRTRCAVPSAKRRDRRATRLRHSLCARVYGACGSAGNRGARQLAQQGSPSPSRVVLCWQPGLSAGACLHSGPDRGTAALLRAVCCGGVNGACGRIPSVASDQCSSRVDGCALRCAQQLSGGAHVRRHRPMPPLAQALVGSGSARACRRVTGARRPREPALAASSHRARPSLRSG